MRNRKDVNSWIEVWQRILIIFSSISLTLTLLAIFAALTGCTKTVYVPTESIRTEYVDRLQLQTRIDSVIKRDSTFVYVNGDTVRITQWKERTKYRNREVRDTLTIVKTDSIQVPYPVEKKMSKWQQTKMDFGGLAIGGILTASIILFTIFLIRRSPK